MCYCLTWVSNLCLYILSLHHISQLLYKWKDMAQMHYYLIVRDLLQSFTKLLSFMCGQVQFCCSCDNRSLRVKGTKTHSYAWIGTGTPLKTMQHFWAYLNIWQVICYDCRTHTHTNLTYICMHTLTHRCTLYILVMRKAKTVYTTHSR